MNTNLNHIDDIRFPVLVALVARTWRKTVDKRLQDFDLSEATWLPLVYLSRLDAPVRQKELAAMLSLDSSSLVRVLNNLEALGLIQRTPEAGDKRAKATVITEQGRAVVNNLESLSKSLEDEVKANLQAADFQVAKQVLLDIFHALDGIQATAAQDDNHAND